MLMVLGALGALGAFAQSSPVAALPESATVEVACTQATLGLSLLQRSNQGGARLPLGALGVIATLSHGTDVLARVVTRYADSGVVGEVAPKKPDPVAVPADVAEVRARVDAALADDVPLLRVLGGMGLSWTCTPLEPAPKMP